MASGAACGLILFIAAYMLCVVNALSVGLADAVAALLMGAFLLAPFFVVAILLLAAFGTLGGIVIEIMLIGWRMINKKPERPT